MTESDRHRPAVTPPALRFERPHTDAPVSSGPPSPPSSRRGGAILLGLAGVAIVAVILIAVLNSGGSAPAHRLAAGNTPASGTPTSGQTGSTSTTATQMLAQLNLTSPTGTKATVGIAQVIRVKGTVGLVIDAQGVPPNTKHNAYAVWLSNSASSSHKLLGFLPNLVGSSGKLAGEGALPAGATAYNRLLITLETQSKPTSPGQVVLAGPFREHP